MAEKTGVIILAHGSRGERGSTEVPEVLRTITEGVKPLLSEGVEVVGAALQFNRPDLEEAVASLVARAVTRIVIMPYFLFLGRHITEHIPGILERLGGQYPEVQFTVARTLGVDEYFISLTAKRIEECAPWLLSRWPDPSIHPHDIERHSLTIVERLVPALKNMPPEEQAVVKRLVHASGDPQIAHMVRLSPSAIASGVNSIMAGSPIITDVQMVATGINRNLVRTFGGSVRCALEELRKDSPEETDMTRAAAGIRRLGPDLDGALVAIGNAPTALLSLLDLIDNDGVRPALIVGMPVGFVQARESKDELMKREVPYITVPGTRGGSALAVATVNALLKIALERQKQPAGSEGILK